MSLSLWHSSKSLVRILRASLLLLSFFLQTLYWKWSSHKITNISITGAPQYTPLVSQHNSYHLYSIVDNSVATPTVMEVWWELWKEKALPQIGTCKSGVYNIKNSVVGGKGPRFSTEGCTGILWMPSFRIHSRKGALISYNFLAKHATWMPRFQYLA